MFDNKKRLIAALINAKYNYKIGNKIKHTNSLILSIGILKQIKHPKDILIFEATCIDIYDTNFTCSNINKINNKLLACSSAISEFDLFTDNKDMFLERFKNSRITNIKADGIFEKSVKEIIRYLGSEKNTALIEKITKEFFEARQNNLRNIVTDFTKARINFLSKQGLER